MIRIGILGASRICKDAIIGPARGRDDVGVVALASRDPHRASQFAEQAGITPSIMTYDELIQMPDVDLVYVGLPPHHHHEWSIKALNCGKHVLCEKPIALNAEQASEMVAAARQNDCFLIEAFHHRYHPLFQHILSLVDDPHMGKVHLLKAHCRVPVPHSQTEFRYKKSHGGGAFRDLGCYPVHWARTILGENPVHITARCFRAEDGVDVEASAVMAFPSGAMADVHCSMDPSLSPGVDAKIEVYAENGWFEVDNPLQPEFGSQIRVCFDGLSYVEAFSGPTFPHQLSYIVEQIEGGRPALTGGPDAIDNMAVIDAVTNQIDKTARDGDPPEVAFRNSPSFGTEPRGTP